MNEDLFKPIWIKAVLGFLLFMIGIAFTFLVFRFIPIPKQTGYDGLSGLLLVLFSLGAVEILYILGIIAKRNHPYVVFSCCLILFMIILLSIRWLVIG